MIREKIKAYELWYEANNSLWLEENILSRWHFLNGLSCNNFRKRQKDGSGKILSETRTQGVTGEVD